MAEKVMKDINPHCVIKRNKDSAVRDLPPFCCKIYAEGLDDMHEFLAHSADLNPLATLARFTFSCMIEIACTAET